MVERIAPAAAAAAYQATQTGTGDGQDAPADSFGATLGRAFEDAVTSGHLADTASGNALVGQGSVTDVVLAVSKAEMALQTTVAVRDRVIAAYQDVMRMPI